MAAPSWPLLAASDEVQAKVSLPCAFLPCQQGQLAPDDGSWLPSTIPLPPGTSLSAPQRVSLLLAAPPLPTSSAPCPQCSAPHSPPD